MAIEVNGQSIETDEEGYLANRTDWNEEIATAMAKADDCDLSQHGCRIEATSTGLGEQLWISNDGVASDEQEITHRGKHCMASGGLSKSVSSK